MTKQHKRKRQKKKKLEREKKWNNKDCKREKRENIPLKKSLIGEKRDQIKKFIERKEKKRK